MTGFGELAGDALRLTPRSITCVGRRTEFIPQCHLNKEYSRQKCASEGEH